VFLIRFRFKFVLFLVASGAAAYYYFVYRPVHQAPVEVAHVIPKVLPVMDTSAEVRLPIDTLKSGDRVEVLARTENWARVRLPNGRIGWVEAQYLLSPSDYEKEDRLLRELITISPQAVGHIENGANLRIEPSRDASKISQLRPNQKLKIFGRQLVERPALTDELSPTNPPRDAWYLVRADARAGWVMGHLVDLDIPQEISAYAQGVNLVAWLVVNTVEDHGRQVPEYLVADRLGTQDLDFNHIRVLTWWIKRQEYVTAYVESNLNGYFPIRIERPNTVPYFRLRMMDEDGRRFQKVYGMFDTLIRPLGTVEGWESDAKPTRSGFRGRGAGHHRRGKGPR